MCSDLLPSGFGPAAMGCWCGVASPEARKGDSVNETGGPISLGSMGKHVATSQMKAAYDPAVRTSTNGLRKSSSRPKPGRLVRHAVEALNGTERAVQARLRGRAGETESGRRR
jgi:hypothetical protein